MNPIKTELEKELIRRQKKNPKYSLRAFARDLGVPASRLSLFLNDQTELGLKNIERIVVGLSHLNDLEKTNLLHAHFSFTQKVQEHGSFERLLSLYEFEKIFSPIHYWILTALELSIPLSTEKILLAFSEYDEEVVRNAIDNLKNLELIKEEKNNLKPTQKGVKTTSDIPSEAIRNYHKAVLNMAIAQIDKQSVEKRDYSSITIAGNPEQLNEVKKILAQTRRKIAKVLQAKGRKSKVYNLSLQLFEVGNFDKK